MKQIIVRQNYLDKIVKYLGREMIIVLTGQRRVGKSCLLKQFYQEKIKDPESNIIFIDKEKREFDFIKNYQNLNDYIDSKFLKDKHNYILIDEIQNIDEFERSIRSYRTEENTDVIVTGSNAKMLSGELSTIIGGRFKEIYIQPLSYEEFLTFHSLDDNDDSLTMYINIGGMPGLNKIGLSEDDVREYQKDIYNTVLLKDVIMRNHIRNVNFLENLVVYMADNAGKIISANNISKYMKSNGENISASVILNYLAYLTDAYIINKVNRYDVHGKRLFDSNEKYYFEDNGIRNAIAGGTREGDIEKVIENVVYNNLVRLGYEIFVGQLQSSEIDFVCTKPNGEKIYIQVSYLIVNDETRQREFGNLMKIQDNYPKYVISMTPLIINNDYDGIKHIHLRNFLRNGI